jgi:spore coat protein U-like protein
MTRTIPVTAVATTVANVDGGCLSHDEPVTTRTTHAVAQALSSASSALTAPTRRGVMRSAILGLAAVMSLCTGTVTQAADPATGTLNVSMNIIAACTVGASTTVAFADTVGASLATTAVTANGAISVNCTNLAPYAIGLDTGANSTGAQRRMLNGSTNYISYNLYTNSGLTTPWALATGPSTCATSTNCYTGTGSGSAQSIPVYGQVPTVGSAPALGSYSDTVNVTVWY